MTWGLWAAFALLLLQGGSSGWDAFTKPVVEHRIGAAIACAALVWAAVAVWQAIP